MARFDDIGDLFGAITPVGNMTKNIYDKNGNLTYGPGTSSSKSSNGIFDFLEGIDNMQKPIFYGIGSGIDAIGDLTLGNLLGLFDENLGKNFKESTTGETYSWIPSSAADFATWLLPGSIPMKLGLLGLKGLAESSKNLKSAATGVDAETGEKLSGAERAGQGLMGALNTALTVLPGAPVAKAAEKSAAKSLIKQSEKNIAGSQVHDLKQLKKELADQDEMIKAYDEQLGAITRPSIPESAQAYTKNGKQSLRAKKGQSNEETKKAIKEYNDAMAEAEKAAAEIEGKKAAASSRKTQLDESISNMTSLIDRELGGKLPGMDEAPKFAGQNWELRTNKAGDVGLMPVPGTADKQGIDLAKALANDSFFPTGSAFQMRRLAAQGGEKKKGLRNAIMGALKGPSEVAPIKEAALPARYKLGVGDIMPQGKTPADLGLGDNPSVEQVYKALSNPLNVEDMYRYGR